jgi:beta-glucosidase
MKRTLIILALFWAAENPALVRGDCPCESSGDPVPPNISAAGAAPASSEEEVPPKYLDATLPVETRIDDLLPRMTLEEKILELRDDWGSKAVPHLKIPALLKTEGLHGQSYSTGATIFPDPIAMAATFDTALIEQEGKATAVEAKAANIHASWSPVLDVARDARWGRVEETFGEDSYLVSRMGVGWIEGFQSENMIAIPKHFAGHGQPLGGRDSNDTGLSERLMRDVYLPPFRAAIEEAHAGGIMAAYSTWDGTPNNASLELLQRILRQEWQFDGIVVSDCGAVENLLNKQNVVSDLEQASRLAILAGVDIECGDAFKKSLLSAIHHGLLRESDLDANVKDVLRTKFRLGLFENPGSPNMVWDKLPAYDTQEHRALARQIAAESAVLLKNENNILPLSTNIKTIAVIGPDVDQAQTGDYTAKPSSGQLVTVLQGIRSHVSSDTRIVFAKGCDVLSDNASGIAEAEAAARQSDAVILVVGDSSHPDGGKSTTGENDDGASLEIPGVQRELIRRVQAVGKPVVLVVVNGKPFTLGWEASNMAAILETWYPGEEGGNATADLIFGEQNPSGRLPITFPRSPGQLPLFYNYLPSGRAYDYYDMPFTPQFRFGYGLSYTTFKYSNLRTDAKPGDPGRVMVSADVENDGNRDGDEVVQLYLTDLQTSVITPVIQLQGFRRVFLGAGEKETVTFELTPYQLSFLNSEMTRVVEPAKFRVHVGGVSPAPPSGGDRHKLLIGFTDSHQGVSGQFEEPVLYQARFQFDFVSPKNVVSGRPFATTLTITNEGNLTDVAEAKLFGDNLLDTYRFEIPPQESRSHTFEVTLQDPGRQNLSVLIGGKLASRNIIARKGK